MNESDDPDRKSQRHAMVAEQIARRGVRSARVLAALERVPRHRFVSEDLLAYAYEDRALKIGRGQTISQPYMVAVMTECLEIGGCERVLEIGTGSGYQAAVLALLAKEVFTIERDESLACSARERLSSLGYNNIRVLLGDGTFGDSEHAPFDALLVAAAAPTVPPPLLEQLAEGGRLVIPWEIWNSRHSREFAKREAKPSRSGSLPANSFRSVAATAARESRCEFET